MQPNPQTVPPPPHPGNGAVAPGDLTSHARKLQDLVVEMEGVADPRTRRLVEDILQTSLQISAVGLRRILEIVSDAPAADTDTYGKLVSDRTVRGLLLIHDLHPDSLDVRMAQALAKVLPFIRSHKGNVELVSLHDGVAKLRLEGTCKTCSSSTLTLEIAVRAAIDEFCPDLLGFEVEGVEEEKVPAPYSTCAAPAPA
jgi:Fe-S cluster biogenesis protein NfuA